MAAHAGPVRAQSRYLRVKQSLSPAEWRRVGGMTGVIVGLHVVGFALTKVDEEEALATRKLLEGMGADYEQELEELRQSLIE